MASGKFLHWFTERDWTRAHAGYPRTKRVVSACQFPPIVSGFYPWRTDEINATKVGRWAAGWAVDAESAP